MDRILPPLPACDEESVNKNKFDPNFKTGSGDFWKDNHRERINLEEKEKCEHYFIIKSDGVMCKKCYMGWVGKQLEAREGKLYIQNKQVEI